MSTGTPIADHIRDAAIADPNHVKRARGYVWTEDEIAYMGGWEVRGGVRYPLFPEQRSA